jgi:CxxC motif-containing protein (DUF1111 family)
MKHTDPARARRVHRSRHAGWLAALATTLVACDGSSFETALREDGALAVLATTAGFTQRPLAAQTLGDPIPGLTQAELDAFERGRALFVKRFTPEEGLGPLYNATSCASCHSTPTVGGSAQHYRNFYLGMFGTAPSQMAFFELPSPVIPAFGPHDLGGSTQFDLEVGRFVIPPDYFGNPVVVAQRNAIPIFGTGLFEFVNNGTILANTDPNDANGDGISGRANFDFGDLGRFGVKAQSNNIERFTRPPLAATRTIVLTRPKATSKRAVGWDTRCRSHWAAQRTKLAANRANCSCRAMPPGERILRGCILKTTLVSLIPASISCRAL